MAKQKTFHDLLRSADPEKFREITLEITDRSIETCLKYIAMRVLGPDLSNDPKVREIQLQFLDRDFKGTDFEEPDFDPMYTTRTNLNQMLVCYANAIWDTMMVVDLEVSQLVERIATIIDTFDELGETETMGMVAGFKFNGEFYNHPLADNPIQTFGEEIVNKWLLDTSKYLKFRYDKLEDNRRAILRAMK